MDFSVLDALVIGGAGGSASAGALAWFFIRRSVVKLEEEFMKKTDCNLVRQINDEKTKLVVQSVDKLSDKLDVLVSQLEKRIDQNLEEYRTHQNTILSLLQGGS